MPRARRFAVIAASVAVLAACMSPAATPALASSGAGACATTARTLTGTLADGATYEIQVPANWNCTLFLYSHGYVAPGSANPAQDVGDPVTGDWLLSHGYALAGSSYATTGWAIQQALPDQISTLDTFDQQVGPPRRTIAWGHSLGGIITAGLIQTLPEPLQRRAAHVRRAVRRGGHLEHGARLGVRVPAADRPVAAGREHHQPHGQPDRRRPGRRRGAAVPAGPGADSARRRAR